MPLEALNGLLGWYLTQLSTMIYVPFFACLAGTGITHQAVGVGAGMSRCRWIAR